MHLTKTFFTGRELTVFWDSVHICTCRNCLNCPNLMATAFPSESLIYFKPENANIPPSPPPSPHLKVLECKTGFFPLFFTECFPFLWGKNAGNFHAEKKLHLTSYILYISQLVLRQPQRILTTKLDQIFMEL